MIQENCTGYTADVVVEKLQEYQEALDLDRLRAYLLRANLATQRIFGFLLDNLELDADELRRSAGQSTAVSKLTPDSTAYNARWRLYYERSLLRNQSA